MSIIGVTSIVCLLVAVIMLMNLIQKAFDKDGITWGFISILYPPGTYMYCRKNWQAYSKKFFTISILMGVGLVLLLLVKIAH